MPLVNFSNLDFDQVKISLREYLRSNSNFTDYDFEGSNLSTILNVLAYNTYITSYNANMVSNEVFIDSATLRENVVSLARNIGYLPKSRKAAAATVSFFVDCSQIVPTPSSITLSAGPVASTAGALGPLNEKIKGKRVGVVICGTNTDPASFTNLINRGMKSLTNDTFYTGKQRIS